MGCTSLTEYATVLASLYLTAMGGVLEIVSPAISIRAVKSFPTNQPRRGNSHVRRSKPTTERKRCIGRKAGRDVQKMGANRATHPVKYMDDNDQYVEAKVVIEFINT